MKKKTKDDAQRLAEQLSRLAVDAAAHQLASTRVAMPMDSLNDRPMEVCEDQARRLEFLDSVADRMRSLKFTASGGST